MSKPEGSMRTSPPMIRVSWMLPTARSPGRPSRPSAPGPSPRRAPGGARRRSRRGCGWTGCRRSRPACRSPVAIASAARYSSLRTLLPPKAMPLLQSSRLAQISTLPPSAAERRGSGWTATGRRSGDGAGNGLGPWLGSGVQLAAAGASAAPDLRGSGPRGRQPARHREGGRLHPRCALLLLWQRSKEEIYGDLLAGSLDRLQAAVRAAVVGGRAATG